jgi:hypothetical protein
MKSLLILILALFAGNAFAGSATFNWTMPVPIWVPLPDGSQPIVPADWTIDEYRIKCVAVVPGQPDNSYTRTVRGFASNTVTYDDLPNGDTTCHMTSYSAGAGTESAPSIEVTKFIMDAVTPAPPTIFDFVPLVSSLGLPIPANQNIQATSTIVIAGHAYKIDCVIRLTHMGKLTTVCER